MKRGLIRILGLLALLSAVPASAADECFGNKPAAVRLDECSKLIQSNSKNAAALLERGRIYLELERYDEASIDLDRVTRLNPKSHIASELRSVARELARNHINGRQEQAIRAIDQDNGLRLEQLDEQIRQNPKSEELFIKRAEIRATTKRYADAVADLGEAIAINPKRLENYWERARINYFFRDKSQAFNDLARAIAIEPENPKNYWTRVRYYRYESDGHGVISDDSKLIEFVTSNNGDSSQLIGLLMDRAAAFGWQGKCDAAVADIDRAITLDGTDAKAHDFRGYLNAQCRRNEQALKDFDLALKLAPNLTVALSSRCAVNIEIGDFQSARADCDSAIKSDPKLPNAYKHRGIARLKLGQMTEAVADIDKAIELNPKYAAALVARAELYEGEGKAKEAIDRFEQALASPTRPGNYDDKRARETAKAALDRLKLVQQK